MQSALSILRILCSLLKEIFSTSGASYESDLIASPTNAFLFAFEKKKEYRNYVQIRPPVIPQTEVVASMSDLLERRICANIYYPPYKSNLYCEELVKKRYGETRLSP